MNNAGIIPGVKISAGLAAPQLHQYRGGHAFHSSSRTAFDERPKDVIGCSHSGSRPQCAVKVLQPPQALIHGNRSENMVATSCSVITNPERYDLPALC